jgi:ribosomal protein S3
VEEGLCVASVFGPVDYWIGGSAACYGVCGVVVWVVKGKIMSQSEYVEMAKIV